MANLMKGSTGTSSTASMASSSRITAADPWATVRRRSIVRWRGGVRADAVTEIRAVGQIVHLDEDPELLIRPEAEILGDARVQVEQRKAAGISDTERGALGDF